MLGKSTIRISEEAKERLDLRKREGESYSDVVLRLTEADQWAAFGIVESDDFVEEMDRLREEARHRGRERREAYFEHPE